MDHYSDFKSPATILHVYVYILPQQLVYCIL